MYQLGNIFARVGKYALAASWFQDFLNCRLEKDRKYAKGLHLRCENEVEEEVDWWGLRGRVGLEMCRANLMWPNQIAGIDVWNEERCCRRCMFRRLKDLPEEAAARIRSSVSVPRAAITKARQALQKDMEDFRELPLQACRSEEKRMQKRTLVLLQDMIKKSTKTSNLHDEKLKIIDDSTESSIDPEENEDGSGIMDALAELIVLNDHAPNSSTFASNRILHRNREDEEDARAKLAVSRLRQANDAIESRMKNGKLMKVVQREFDELEAAARIVASSSGLDAASKKLLQHAQELRATCKQSLHNRMRGPECTPVPAIEIRAEQLSTAVLESCEPPPLPWVPEENDADMIVAKGALAVMEHDAVPTAPEQDQYAMLSTSPPRSRRERQQQRRQRYRSAKVEAQRAIAEDFAKQTLLQMQQQVVENGVEATPDWTPVKLNELETPPKVANQRRRHCRPKFSMTLAELWKDMDWANDDCVASNAPGQQRGETAHILQQSDGDNEISDDSCINVNPHDVLFTHNSISCFFRNGNGLDESIESIKTGNSTVQAYPPLELVRHDGMLWSLSNRRLYVFRVLSSMGIVDKVKAAIYPMADERVQRLRWNSHLGMYASKWTRAFSTRNGGRFVTVTSQYESLQHSANTVCAYLGNKQGRSMSVTQRRKSLRCSHRAASVG